MLIGFVSGEWLAQPLRATNLKSVVVLSSARNLKDNFEYSLLFLKVLGNQVLTMGNPISVIGCPMDDQV